MPRRRSASLFALVGLTLIALAVLLLTSPTAAAAQEATPDPTLVNLPVENGRYFDTSGLCATCHRNMVDEHGNDISFDTAWRATMMANSGRDPYWRAGLRR